jgi:DNA-binding NarL/FixJ family response regulator
MTSSCAYAAGLPWSDLALARLRRFWNPSTHQSTSWRHKDEAYEMAKNKEVLRLGRFERKKIEKRRDQESDKRIFRRLSALLGLDDGCSQEEVARFLGTTARTVRRWKNIYRKAGLDGLCVLANEGRKCSLTDAQLETLREHVKGRNTAWYSNSNSCRRILPT